MVAPLGIPTDVMVPIDADIIVTSCLDRLIEDARPGKDRRLRGPCHGPLRGAWSELLGLLASVSDRQPYVNSGLVVAGRELGTRASRRGRCGLRAVEVELTVIAHGTPDYPFYYLDQDVLNAVCLGHFRTGSSRGARLPARSVSAVRRAEVVDEVVADVLVRGRRGALRAAPHRE